MADCNELDDHEFITYAEEQGWQVKPATNFELPIFVNPQANTFRCNLMFDMVKIVTEAIHDYQNYFGNNRFDKYWNVEIRLSLRPHFEHAVHQLLTKSKIPLPLRLIHVLLTAQEHWSVIIQEAKPILDELEGADRPAKLTRMLKKHECRVVNLALMYDKRPYSRNMDKLLKKYRSRRFTCDWGAFECDTAEIVVDPEQLGAIPLKHEEVLGGLAPF